MADHFMVTGSSRPSVIAQLRGSTGPIDLTGSTVTFSLSKHGKKFVDDVAAVLVVASVGLVRFDWLTTQLTESGTFTGRFKVTFPDASVQFWPAGDVAFIVQVSDDDGAG